MSDTKAFIPEKSDLFVPSVNAEVLEKIISRGSFFPVLIVGESGYGKSFTVEQICARLNREYIRLQISRATDEYDLIGGQKLVESNGTTITEFDEGPVIHAMRAGAVLLLDELDRGDNKIMCLQGVLEGKPVMIKKTKEVIYPAPGFTVIATANTSGRGDETGKYTAASVIDTAFLERFAITLNHEPPTADVEWEILKRHMTAQGVDTEAKEHRAAMMHFVKFAEKVRSESWGGAFLDDISTRRLTQIGEAYAIFGDRRQAVMMCIARFDEPTRQAYSEFFDAMRVDIEEMIRDDDYATTAFDKLKRAAEGTWVSSIGSEDSRKETIIINSMDPSNTDITAMKVEIVQSVRALSGETLRECKNFVDDIITSSNSALPAAIHVSLNASYTDITNAKDIFRQAFGSYKVKP